MLLGAVRSHVPARPADRQSFSYRVGSCRLQGIVYIYSMFECSALLTPPAGHPGQLAYTYTAITLGIYLCGLRPPLSFVDLFQRRLRWTQTICTYSMLRWTSCMFSYDRDEMDLLLNNIGVPLTSALLNLPKGKSLGRSKPATNS